MTADKTDSNANSDSNANDNPNSRIMKTEKDKDKDKEKQASAYTALNPEPVEWVELPYFANGVRAGWPENVSDQEMEMVLVPKHLAKDASFVVPVRGQSMRDFDLHEGDKLLVKIQETAEVGEIVVALVDGGDTVKVYYEDEAGRKWLLPGNRDFAPIALLPDMDVRIQGVVRQILHETPGLGISECRRIMRSYLSGGQDDAPASVSPAPKFSYFSAYAGKEDKKRIEAALRAAAPKGNKAIVDVLNGNSYYIDIRGVSDLQLHSLFAELGLERKYDSFHNQMKTCKCIRG